MCYLHSLCTDSSDYSATSSQLQGVIPFASPSSPVCVTVSVVDDDILEDDGEMFSARLTSTNARVGSQDTREVSITDNDGKLVY